MKKLMLTALVCGIAATPAMAARDYDDRMAGSQPGAGTDNFAQHIIKKMDRNNDGVVSMDEHEAFNANMFFTVDRNNDQALSRQELMAFKEEKKADHNKVKRR